MVLKSKVICSDATGKQLFSTKTEGIRENVTEVLLSTIGDSILGASQIESEGPLVLPVTMTITIEE